MYICGINSIYNIYIITKGVCKGINPNYTDSIDREALGVAIISGVGRLKSSFSPLHFF